MKQEDRLLKVISYLDVGDGNYWAHPIENPGCGGGSRAEENPED
ncbi:hypothetical protein IE994_16970 [Enterobacter hormaechei]|uniref:Copper amine oxidase N3-terminal domain-containing protein n=1 Tax=Enterobacter hormaechei TaxID=158836 RepID=A0A927DKV4_9ENTR|nr:hypothetical protein [Enterobacter hormaechei]MBD3717270.1 hypothetical protein [Enterobacter hormaechei]